MLAAVVCLASCGSANAAVEVVQSDRLDARTVSTPVPPPSTPSTSAAPAQPPAADRPDVDAVLLAARPLADEFTDDWESSAAEVHRILEPGGIDDAACDLRWLSIERSGRLTQSSWWYRSTESVTHQVVHLESVESAGHTMGDVRSLPDRCDVVTSGRKRTATSIDINDDPDDTWLVIDDDQGGHTLMFIQAVDEFVSTLSLRTETLDDVEATAEWFAAIVQTSSDRLRSAVNTPTSPPVEIESAPAEDSAPTPSRPERLLLTTSLLPEGWRTGDATAPDLLAQPRSTDPNCPIVSVLDTLIADADAQIALTGPSASGAQWILERASSNQSRWSAVDVANDHECRATRSGMINEVENVFLLNPQRREVRWIDRDASTGEITNIVIVVAVPRTVSITQLTGTAIDRAEALSVAQAAAHHIATQP